MKAHTCSVFSFVALGLGAALSSCVYYPNPVPEMPYTPRRTPVHRPAEPEKVVESLAAPTPAPVAAPKPAAPTMSSWAASSEPDPFPAPITRAPLPAPAPAAAPKPTPKPASAITQPTVAPAPLPAPVITPAPAPAPVATPTPPTDKKLLLATDPSKITNDGPIPVATRVEGDPTRVYNPLDPSKTIRIIDRNGNVFPSGKELKVRGTNYHFYVP